MTKFLIDSKLNIHVKDGLTIRDYLTNYKYMLNFDICRLIIFKLITRKTNNFKIRYGRTNIFSIQFILFSFMYIYSVKSRDVIM